MALQLNKTLTGGVVAAECYSRIIEAKYTKEIYPEALEGIRLVVAFYFNKAARDADEHDFTERREYLLEDATKETRDEQYTYLKTLDDFSGAVNI